MYLNQILDTERRMELYCSDWWFMPKSAESVFCVVITSSSGKDRRLLERDAQLLVRGTNAYAQRFKRDFKVNQSLEPDRPILPVIVTNAKLFTAEYEPADVSLDTGQLPVPQPAKLSPVPWIRFRKAFTSGGKDAGDRTVFVVSAPELATWLGKLEITAAGPSEEGKVHIQ
jgi:hypothetical protein